MIVICTNTMHKLADAVQSSVSLPLLHIADVTADAIKSQKKTTVGLLGTRFTMEDDFYRQRLERKHGLEVIIPEERERKTIHSILYNELCLGEIKEMSKETFRRIIEKLSQRGAEGVILGCTEIPLLVEQKDYEVTLFDTTAIHARAAVEFALGG